MSWKEILVKKNRLYFLLILIHFYVNILAFDWSDKRQNLLASLWPSVAPVVDLYIKMKTLHIKMERDKNHQSRTLTFSCFAVLYKQLSFETQDLVWLVVLKWKAARLF